MKKLKPIVTFIILICSIIGCSNDDNMSKGADKIKLKQQLLSSGITVDYIYNSNNFLIKRQQSNGVFTSYTYTAQNKIATVEVGGMAVPNRNRISNNQYNASGALIEEVTVDGSGAKYKYVFTNNASGLPIMRKFFNWNIANNTWQEDQESFRQMEYNTINQLVKIQRSTNYTIYTYDMRGNIIETKGFYKRNDGSYYLHTHDIVTFDDKKTVSTVPISNEVNNALERTEKRFAENGSSTGITVLQYTYEYNEQNYPTKQYLNGNLHLTNIF